ERALAIGKEVEEREVDFAGERPGIGVVDVAADAKREPLARALAHPGSKDFNCQTFRPVPLRKRKEGEAEEVRLDLNDVAADGLAGCVGRVGCLGLGPGSGGGVRMHWGSRAV